MLICECANEEKNFISQTTEYELDFCCVTHLYALFNIDLNVQMSDTTGDQERTKS